VGLRGCEGMLCHIDLFCSLVFHSIFAGHGVLDFPYVVSVEFYITLHFTYK
jgi:hypothetical protein